MKIIPVIQPTGAQQQAQTQIETQNLLVWNVSD